MWNIWISKGSGGYDLPKALDEAVVGMLLNSLNSLNKSGDFFSCPISANTKQQKQQKSEQYIF